jgi:hypothetical protein
MIEPNRIQQSVNSIKRPRHAKITGITCIEMNSDVDAKIGCPYTLLVYVDLLSKGLGTSTWLYNTH